jgi:periplasmic serine protease, Do/DeqQ family
MTDDNRRRRRNLRRSAVVVAAGLALSPLGVPAIAVARPAPESFADLVEQVGPAVVQIATTRSASTGTQMGGALPSLPDEFAEGPFRDFFERFFRDGGRMPSPGESPHGPQARRDGPPAGREMGVGSGFIVSTDGLIVTNNHVVDGAETITVRLKDGQELPAKLVGTDSKTDLAVVKVDAPAALPTLKWGDSEHARVGDWVVAVGNPYGLSGTVTAGIISSRGRDTGASPYVDFIQIDAPLNSGNSGGPLLNDAGDVIGINTAIYSPNGGSVGIGFAIPSDTAKSVVAQLEDKGTVERGWLGIAIQPVTRDVADSLGLSEAKGALVATVTPDSPAAKAGLRQGDVVLDFDGHEVTNPRDLSRVVASAEIGGRKSVSLWRDSKTVNVAVAVGEAPKQQVAAADDTRRAHQEDGASVELAALGLSLAKSGQGPSRKSVSSDGGVIVAGVDPDGEAAGKGIQPGDVILRVNDHTVSSAGEVVKAVERAKTENRKAVLLLVENNTGQHFVPLKLMRA